jgi:bifunctional non-homologous end joining protein LigD
LTFDLDPDEGLPWERMIEAALTTRALLAELGLESFPKATGGKGLHLVVPVTPRLAWAEAKAFAKSAAERLVAAAPERFTANMSKRARRGKIFVDYLRNGRGATAIGAFSTRARPGATVAAPLSWAEVEGGTRSDAFTLSTLPQRLAAEKADPWAGFFAVKQSITAAARRRIGVG